MNKIILSLAAGLLLASIAHADDKVENKNEDTTKTSTNMMGTKTTTHKVKKHVTDGKGKTTEVDKKEVTKVKKDGSVSKDVDADKKTTETK